MGGGGGGKDSSLDYRMIAWYKVHRIKGTIDKDWFMRQVNRNHIDSWYSTILIQPFDKSKQTTIYNLTIIYTEPFLFKKLSFLCVYAVT